MSEKKYLWIVQTFEIFKYTEELVSLADFEKKGFNYLLKNFFENIPIQNLTSINIIWPSQSNLTLLFSFFCNQKLNPKHTYNKLLIYKLFILMLGIQILPNTADSNVYS